MVLENILKPYDPVSTSTLLIVEQLELFESQIVKETHGEFKLLHTQVEFGVTDLFIA